MYLGLSHTFIVICNTWLAGAAKTNVRDVATLDIALTIAAHTSATANQAAARQLARTMPAPNGSAIRDYTNKGTPTTRATHATPKPSQYYGYADARECICMRHHNSISIIVPDNTRPQPMTNAARATHTHARDITVTYDNTERVVEWRR